MNQPVALAFFVAMSVLGVPPAIAPASELSSMLGDYSRARAVIAQSDGKVVAGGESRSKFEYPDQATDFGLTRYESDGTPDETFGSRGVVVSDFGSDDEDLSDLALQDDGRILACGTSGGAALLVRYDANGALDPGFGTGGVVAPPLDTCRAVIVLPDARIAIAGRGTMLPNGGVAVALFGSDGTPDASFGDGGMATIGSMRGAFDVAVQDDGKLVVVGESDYKMPAIVRFGTDGSLDPAFGSGGSVSAPGFGTHGAIATSVIVQTDGRILVAAAEHDSYYSNRLMRLARYDASGQLDPTFGSGGTYLLPLYLGSGEVRFDLAVLTDGRIVVSGDCSDTWIIVRLLPDGSLDTSFDVDGIVLPNVAATYYYSRAGCGLAVDPVGRIVTAGYSAVGYNEMFALSRRTADGGADTAFGVDGKLVESDCLRFPIDSATCRSARKSKLKLRVRPVRFSDERKLAWGWSYGESFSAADLGVPGTDTRFTLCMYEKRDGVRRLLTWFDFIGFSDSWTSKGDSGWSYDGGKYGNADGIESLLLRASATGSPTRASLRISGYASSYNDSTIPAAINGAAYFDEGSQIDLQLVGSNGFCLKSEFLAAAAPKNTARLFRVTSRSITSTLGP